MTALMALARAALGGAGRRSFAGAGTALMAGELGGAILGGGSDPALPMRRRRRRKMFTDTDLAQFAAAEGIAGKKAASNLMMIRAAKS